MPQKSIFSAFLLFYVIFFTFCFSKYAVFVFFLKVFLFVTPQWHCPVQKHIKFSAVVLLKKVHKFVYNNLFYVVFFCLYKLQIKRYRCRRWLAGSPTCFHIAYFNRWIWNFAFYYFFVTFFYKFRKNLFCPAYKPFFIYFFNFFFKSNGFRFRLLPDDHRLQLPDSGVHRYHASLPDRLVPD